MGIITCCWIDDGISDGGISEGISVNTIVRSRRTELTRVVGISGEISVVGISGEISVVRNS